MQIHELVDEMTSIADAGNYLAVDNGVITQKIDYLRLAKAIIEVYNGTSLNGSNQTIQNAISGLSEDVSELSISADTYSDFYSKCLAMDFIQTRMFYVDGAVSSVITGGNVSVRIKGLVVKMDETNNIYDFLATDSSGGVLSFRTRFVSSSEAVLQFYKSTASMESDISALTNKAVASLGTSIPSGANLNDYTTPGRYFAADASSITNCPLSGVSGSSLDLIVMPRASSVRVYQTAYIYTSATQYIYMRSMTGASSWGSWTEVTNYGLTNRISANVKLEVTTIPTAGLTVTLSNNYRGYMFTNDTDQARMGIFALRATSTGSTGYKTMVAASGLTITAGTTANKMTIAPSSTGSIATLFVTTLGSVSW